MRRPCHVLCSALCLLLWLGGCKRGEDRDEAKHQAEGGAEAKPEPEPLPELEMIPNREDASAGARPNLVVELPPAPAPDRFALPEVPARYEDGAFSIRGLRADIDGQLKRSAEGGEVIVRGWVQQIENPPADCRMCPQPHLFVTDLPNKDAPRFRMLVGPHKFEIPEWDAEMWAGVPDVEIEVGKQYLFRGKFVRVSDTGFSDRRGMLQFIAVQREDGQWVYPRGAGWHPIVVELMEEQEAALQAKMREAAERQGRRSD